jgi:hypothetical protein
VTSQGAVVPRVNPVSAGTGTANFNQDAAGVAGAPGLVVLNDDVETLVDVGEGCLPAEITSVLFPLDECFQFVVGRLPCLPVLGVGLPLVDRDMVF